jgi:hypothetical protein
VAAGGVGDGAGVELLSSSPHPEIVIVTPASIANALSTVNSRLVRRFSSLIDSSWAVRGYQETCQRVQPRLIKGGPDAAFMNSSDKTGPEGRVTDETGGALPGASTQRVNKTPNLLPAIPCSLPARSRLNAWQAASPQC